MVIRLDLSLTGQSIVQFTEDYALLHERAPSPEMTREALDTLKTVLLQEARQVMRSYGSTAEGLRAVRAIRVDKGGPIVVPLQFTDAPHNQEDQ